MINKIKTYSVPILYMLLIFVLSSVPVDVEDKMMGVYIEAKLQNVLHIPLYGLLAWLWMRAFLFQRDTRYTIRNTNKKAITYTLLIAISYSIFDEFHQYFVPGRYMNVMDILFNVVGCFAGVWVYKLGSRRVSVGRSS